MKKFMGIIGVFVLMSMVVLGVYSNSTAAASASAKPRYGGTLFLSDFTEENVIGYPPRMMRPLAQRQGGPAIETLLRADKELRLIPWLATAFKEDPKAMAVTLTLRKGVKFHDGTDFNAEAVKWNLEQSISAKGAGTDNIKSVVVVSDSTIQINLASWDSTFTANLSQTMGMMISPTA